MFTLIWNRLHHAVANTLGKLLHGHSTTRRLSKVDAYTKYKYLFQGPTLVYSQDDDEKNNDKKQIFIGSCIDAAATTDQFDLVINCAEDLPQLPDESVAYHHIPLMDGPSSSLADADPAHWEQAQLMVAAHSRILFHCVFGSSRSVACAIKVLCDSYPQLDSTSLYHMFRSHRPSIDLNMTFASELKLTAAQLQ